MAIADNITKINAKIQTAMGSRKNTVFSEAYAVKLVAVTKNQNVAAIREARDQGITAIAENRVQEALTKQALLGEDYEWHFIGHLQTNKVRQVVPLFDIIHSVDSVHLAEEISRIAIRHGKRQKILIQVNAAGEETKFGIPPEHTLTLARHICNMENVILSGLMTIAPLCSDPEETRPVFQKMFRIFMELKSSNLPNAELKFLSMGMTNDCHIAIEEGSNLVRIGAGIFGERPGVSKEEST